MSICCITAIHRLSLLKIRKLRRFVNIAAIHRFRSYDLRLDKMCASLLQYVCYDNRGVYDEGRYNWPVRASLLMPPNNISRYHDGVEH